jgi:hypothetical protein
MTLAEWYSTSVVTNQKAFGTMVNKATPTIQACE